MEDDTLREFYRRQTTTNYESGSTINTGHPATDTFLNLIADPFASEVQATAFYAALGWSLGFGTLLFLLFCLLRPRVSTIYAPRAKYADAKHAPPQVSRSFFGWWPTLKAVKEHELMDKIGLDATLFLRFLKMTRNIMAILTVIGCGILIPVTLINRDLKVSDGSTISVFMVITPIYISGNRMWAWVVFAYLSTTVILFFLWRNYIVVSHLRRSYFESEDYRNSLHSRTLMEIKPVESPPNAAVARNVRELPELIEEHKETVEGLEKVLAKYLANPDRLPNQRPMMKPSKNDKGHSHGQEVDAINYLTSRIAELEREINEVRETVDRRNPLPYGFASYTYVEDAHSVAYATRKNKPHGATVSLAPKPHDIIWKNLPLTRSARRKHALVNNFWMVLMTILYIPPNVLTAVFLSNLNNLAQVWPGFRKSYGEHPTGWGIVQGIAAPALQLLFFLFLPTIFRRLLIRSGDITKTSRERHVASKLYAFNFFNKVFVFSVFASAWAFLATVINSEKQDIWDSIKEGQLAIKVVLGLCSISPFWITAQLQAYLGSAVDILQAWPLVWNFLLRKFSNPTPRQLVELTAPQPFEYSSYYSNYLVILTVGFSFGTLQPLILPVTAAYFMLEAWFKRYLLQYVLITKIESGGAFWRIVFNRILFATFVMNAVITLLVGTRSYTYSPVWYMLPLYPIIAAFKWYCAYTLDTKYTYYTTKSFFETETSDDKTASHGAGRQPRQTSDRVGVRFGNPALYKKLMTPMVHEKARNILKQVYRGRLDSVSGQNITASRPNSLFGYSDIYMSQMSPAVPGKVVKSRSEPFEIVAESDLDFENFKRRPEFRDSYGGDGELYGRPADDVASRPATPSSMYSFGAASTLMSKQYGDSKRNRSESPSTRNTSRTRDDGMNLDGETTYSKGYAGIPNIGDQSPSGYSRTHIRDFSGSGVGSGAGSATPGASPAMRPRLPRLESVDIPDAGLDRGEITEAGIEAYRDDESLDRYQTRRLSHGSMSGMLQNASGMGQSSTPTSATGDRAHGVRRKPVRSSQLIGGEYEYSQGGSSGFAGTPTEGLLNDDEPTSYDHFRRGRKA